MTLAAVVSSWSFSGNTVTVNVTVTGGTPNYSVLYLWDDGANTPHTTASTSDSASHTYASYDYDTEPSPGAYPHTLTIAIDDSASAGVVLTLGLPVPRPLLVFAPETGPAPLTVAVTGSNSRTDADPLDNYPAGVSDVTYDYSSSDGWTDSETGPGVVSHTWTTVGVFDTTLRIENSLGWAKSYGPVALPVVTTGAPLRQFPRDDTLGGAPRQGHGSRSVQASARQGWSGTYR